MSVGWRGPLTRRVTVTVRPRAPIPRRPAMRRPDQRDARRGAEELAAADGARLHSPGPASSTSSADPQGGLQTTVTTRRSACKPAANSHLGLSALPRRLEPVVRENRAKVRACLDRLEVDTMFFRHAASKDQHFPEYIQA